MSPVTSQDNRNRAICRLLGHSWRLLSERWVNANRHDLGGARTWYCVRCLAEKETRR